MKKISTLSYVIILFWFQSYFHIAYPQIVHPNIASNVTSNATSKSLKKILSLRKKKYHSPCRPDFKCFMSEVKTGIDSLINKASFKPSIFSSTSRSSLSHYTEFDLFEIHDDGKSQGEIKRDSALPYKLVKGEDLDDYVLVLTGQAMKFEHQIEVAEEVKETLNSDVVFVVNQTQGLVNDCLTTVYSNLGGVHQAVEDTFQILQGHLIKKPKMIFAHSQGSSILTSALNHITEKERLDLNVHLFGGAARTFPYGPHYFHHINVLDAIPIITGNLKWTYLQKAQNLTPQFKYYIDDKEGEFFFYHQMGLGRHSFKRYLKTWHEEWLKKYLHQHFIN